MVEKRSIDKVKKAQVHQGSTPLKKENVAKKEEKEPKSQKTLAQEMAAEMPSSPSIATSAALIESKNVQSEVAQLDRISECEETASNWTEEDLADALVDQCQIVEEKEEASGHVNDGRDVMEDDGFVKVSHKKKKERTPIRQMAPEEGWITPENVGRVKQRLSTTKSAPKLSESKDLKKDPVVAITGDFAMQNILLQLGAHLLAKDGQRITQIRQYVLRCHACSK